MDSHILNRLDGSQIALKIGRDIERQRLRGIEGFVPDAGVKTRVEQIIDAAKRIAVRQLLYRKGVQMPDGCPSREALADARSKRCLIAAREHEAPLPRPRVDLDLNLRQ